MKFPPKKPFLGQSLSRKHYIPCLAFVLYKKDAFHLNFSGINTEFVIYYRETSYTKWQNLYFIINQLFLGLKVCMLNLNHQHTKRDWTKVLAKYH